MRLLARYIKQGYPSLEIQTRTGKQYDYIVVTGGRVLERFEVGDTDAIAFCKLLINRKIKQGYENALKGEL